MTIIPAKHCMYHSALCKYQHFVTEERAANSYLRRHSITDQSRRRRPLWRPRSEKHHAHAECRSSQPAIPKLCSVLHIFAPATTVIYRAAEPGVEGNYNRRYNSIQTHEISFQCAYQNKRNAPCPRLHINAKEMPTRTKDIKLFTMTAAYPVYSGVFLPAP